MKVEKYFGKKAIHVSSIKLTFPVGTVFSFFNREGKDYVEVAGKEYEKTFEFDVAINKNMLSKEKVEKVEEKEKETKKLYDVVKSDEDAMERELKIINIDQKDFNNKKKNGLEIIKESAESEVRGMKVVSQVPEQEKKEKVIIQDGIKITMNTGNISEQKTIMSEEEQGTVVKKIGHGETDVVKESKTATKKGSAKKEAMEKAKTRKTEVLKNREKAK